MSNKTNAFYLTNDDEACELLASNHVALLIGFVLDQQITIQKAFAGPLELQRRIGTLDPRSIAAMDPDALRAAFVSKPALHRFPAAMADRVQALMVKLVEEYDGDPANLWRAADGSYDKLQKLVTKLPGFGPGKVVGLAGLLNQQGIEIDGWEARAMPWGSVGFVDSREALVEYQQRKNAYKKAKKAAAAGH